MSFRRPNGQWRRENHKTPGSMLMCGASQESPKSDIRWRGQMPAVAAELCNSGLRQTPSLRSKSPANSDPMLCMVLPCLRVSTRQSMSQTAHVSAPVNQLSPICLPYATLLFLLACPWTDCPSSSILTAHAFDLVDSICWCSHHPFIPQELPSLWWLF